MLDLFAGGQRGEGFEAQIDADGRLKLNRRLWGNFLINFHQNCREIFPGRRLPERDSFHLAVEDARIFSQLQTNMADLWKVDRLFLEVRLDALRELTGLAVILARLKLRKPALLFEKLREGIVQVPQGHLQRLGVGIFQPGEFGF